MYLRRQGIKHKNTHTHEGRRAPVRLYALDDGYAHIAGPYPDGCVYVDERTPPRIAEDIVRQLEAAQAIASVSWPT